MTTERASTETPTGTCPGCGRTITLTGAGRIARHNMPWNRGKKCYGSGCPSRDQLPARRMTPTEQALARKMFG